MKIYKIAQEDLFDSMFDINEMKERLSKRGAEIVGEELSRPETLTLYRGFDYLPDPVEGDRHVLNPERSEQGVLWFSHKLITGYNALEYAKDHGRYLLTYPLEVIKHYQVIGYENSSETIERIPQNILDKQEGTENCRYYMGYELPLDWYFSYKMEKFIICDRDLVVNSSMIS